jgi:hypothetical protein
MKNLIFNDVPQGSVDRLLRSFFKREMPDPWPDARLPAPSGGVLQQRSWLLIHGRLALVASITLMLVSYVTLAALFPGEPPAGLYLDRSHTIGSKPGPKERVPTARGGEALIWDERVPALPGERPQINIYSVQIKPPQKR